MQYRRMGSTGLLVSEISLGSWLTYGNAVEKLRESWGDDAVTFATAEIPLPSRRLAGTASCRSAPPTRLSCSRRVPGA